MARPPGHGPDFEKRHDEIVDIAASLFAKKGYAAVGTNDLCAAVGLGKGALYNYIGSKEALLVKIQARVVVPLLADSRSINSVGGDAVVRLRLLSEALLVGIFARVDHIWVYEHDYRLLSGPSKRQILAVREEYEKLVSSVVAEAQDAKQFGTNDLRLTVLQYFNMHNRTYQWVDPQGALRPADLSREYCKTLFRGFAAPGFDGTYVEQEAMQLRRTLVESGALFQVDPTYLVDDVLSTG